MQRFTLCIQAKLNAISSEFKFKQNSMTDSDNLRKNLSHIIAFSIFLTIPFLVDLYVVDKIIMILVADMNRYRAILTDHM